MFKLSKKKQCEILPQVFEEPMLVKPKPHLVLVKDDPIEEYEKLADELEYHPAGLVEAKIFRYLKENNIPVFNNKEVYDYLARKAKEEGDHKYWIWRPLREKDHYPKGWGWTGWFDFENHNWGHGTYWEHKSEYRIYDKLVPANILRQVRDMEAAIPHDIKFFVSDYASINPDPFIMVTNVDIKRIIFNVWDEPDFGM